MVNRTASMDASSASRWHVADGAFKPEGEPRHAKAGWSADAPAPSPEAPSTSGSSEGAQKDSKKAGDLPAKSCKGCLYFSNMRAAKGGKPFCIGVTRKEGDQELRGVDAGKERPTSQEFRYACLGYSVWEDAAASRGGDVGAQMPAVLCTGLELVATKDPQEATSSGAPTGTTQDDQRKPSPIPHPVPTFPSDDFRLRFQRSAGRLAEHTFHNLQKIGSKLKESVSNLVNQDKHRPKP